MAGLESERVDGEGKKRKREKGQTRWMKALYVPIDRRRSCRRACPLATSSSYGNFWSGSFLLPDAPLIHPSIHPPIPSIITTPSKFPSLLLAYCEQKSLGPDGIASCNAASQGLSWGRAHPPISIVGPGVANEREKLGREGE